MTIAVTQAGSPAGSQPGSEPVGAPKPPQWVEVGPLQAIPPRGARVVAGAQGAIAVFRTAGDEVFALRDRCPHRGGPLSQGIVHGRSVACPLHDWNIALDSGEAVAPDKGCVQRFEVEVRNGTVWLNLLPVPTAQPDTAGLQTPG